MTCALASHSRASPSAGSVSLQMEAPPAVGWTTKEELIRCVQCCKAYGEDRNREESCLYHCGEPIPVSAVDVTAVWYACCQVTAPAELNTATEVSGCCRGEHKGRHHAEYPYSTYIATMQKMSAKAKELWMEVITSDPVGPGLYEWAEVGLSETDSMYVVVGNEERSIEFSVFTTDQLKQWQGRQLTVFERKDASGWTARLEVQPVIGCKYQTAVTVSLMPACPGTTPVSKTLVVCLHGSVPRFLRVETLSKDPLSQPLKTYSVPENTYEGTQLEVDLDYHNFSKGRKNDYHTDTENGCILKIHQEGDTVTFSRYSNTDIGRWDNTFSAMIKIMNESEETVTIAGVTTGDYLDHRGEWTRCDNALITKDILPMYKWCLSTQNFLELAPGFADTLTVQLNISFSGSVDKPCQRGHAHHSLPQPLHLRVNLLTKDQRSTSLRFEQGNSTVVPTREFWEEELKRKLLFYVSADDRPQMKRAEAIVYYGEPGQLVYRRSTGSAMSPPTPLWPYLHFAAHHAKMAGENEYDLTELSETSERRTVRISALVDLDEEVAYALKVLIQTPTSKATSYYLIPYVDPLGAKLTVEPKQVSANCEFSIRWKVPMATVGDTIAIFKPHGRSPVVTETNWGCLDQGHTNMKVPRPGFYEVRYYSSLLTAQFPCHHERYWCSGNVVVTGT